MAKGKRKISKVIVHHSASSVDTTVEDIDRWHKARGWSGIGYHWVLLEDGTFAKGRSENRQGAHCKGHNKDSIGICITGEFHKYHCPNPRFSQLLDLIGSVLTRHNLQWKDVFVHSDFGDTQCCGHFLKAQLKQALKGRR